MATHPSTTTADDLLTMGDSGPCELIQGQFVRTNLRAFEVGVIAMQVGSLLSEHADRCALGMVTSTGTGFLTARNPDTVRAPDAAFVSADRLSSLPRRGFFEGAPDLAVEVVSPDDRWSEVTEKANVWLNAGTKTVWLVDPPNRTVTVYSQANDVRVLREQDTFDAGDTLPRFTVVVRDLFPTWPSDTVK